MRGRTQADRLSEMMQKHQIYDHYTLALPLIEVKSGKFQKGDVILLDLKYLSLILLEGQKVCAGLLPTGTQGDSFEVISVQKDHERIKVSPKHQVLILALDKIRHKRVKIGDIIKIADIPFDQIDILEDSKKIAQGSLVNVDGKIALQIDKVEEKK